MRYNKFILLSLLISSLFSASLIFAQDAKPDPDASRAAFMRVYKVLMSPRCQNCHPAGDSPLQGDDSHVHLQDVQRGADGHGIYGMRCNTCHQSANLPGEHMPPGNPTWGLPKPQHKLTFEGRSPAQLCGQLKDPNQNGGLSLQGIVHHMGDKGLVAWAWNPGDGRNPPPISQEELIRQTKLWVDSGAACPE